MSLQRKFSLEEDFMNYSTDDLLFGLMYSMATYNPNYFKLYLSKKKVTTNRKQIYAVCDLDSRKLNYHLGKLKDRGLIQEEKMYVNSEEIPVYTFPSAEKGNFKYQLINKEMLDYLVATRNRQAIRTYLYLLDGYLWKQKEKDYFIFTNKDILRKLEYNLTSATAKESITYVLESLKREGIINYEEFYDSWVDKDGKSVPYPRKRLLYVAKTVDELRQV